MAKRTKGDFSVKNYKGERFWFSEWVGRLAAILGDGNRLPADVTHHMLVDAFRRNETPEHFLQTISQAA